LKAAAELVGREEKLFLVLTKDLGHDEEGLARAATAKKTFRLIIQPVKMQGSPPTGGR